MTGRTPPPTDDTCGARNRAGNPCRRPAGWGTDHPGAGRCKLHGGNTPNGRKQGQRLLAEQLVRREAGQLLDELAVTAKHPLDALLEALDHAGTMVAALRLLVAGLELASEHDILQTVTGPRFFVTTPGLTGLKPTGEGAPHVLVALYGEWLDRYGKIAKLALDAGIDERRTQLAESTAGRLFTAVDRALSTLPEGVRNTFREALANELRALPTG